MFDCDEHFTVSPITRDLEARDEEIQSLKKALFREQNAREEDNRVNEERIRTIGQERLKLATDHINVRNQNIKLERERQLTIITKGEEVKRNEKNMIEKVKNLQKRINELQLTHAMDLEEQKELASDVAMLRKEKQELNQYISQRKGGIKRNHQLEQAGYSQPRETIRIVNKCKAEHKAMQDEIPDDLHDKSLNELLCENVPNTTPSITALNEETRKLKTQIREIMGQLEDSKKKEQRYSRQLLECQANLEDEKLESTTKIDDLKSKLYHMRTRENGLQEQEKERYRLTQQKSPQLALEIENYKKELLDIKHDRYQTEKKYFENECLLREQIDTVQKDLDAERLNLEKVRRDLEYERQQAQNAIGQLSVHQVNEKTLTTKLVRIREELSRERIELRETEARLKSLSSEKFMDQSSTERHNETNWDLSSKRDDRDQQQRMLQLTTAKEMSEAQVERLRQQLAKVEEDLNQNKKGNTENENKLNNELETVKHDLCDTKTSLEKERHDMQVHLHKCRKAAEQMSAIEKDSQRTLKCKLESTADALRQSSRELNDANTRHKVLSEELTHAKDKIKGLEGRNVELKNELNATKEGHKEQIIQFGVTKEHHRAEAETMRQELTTIKKEQKQSRSQHDEKELQIEQELTAAQQDLCNTKDRLEKERRDMQKQLSQAQEQQTNLKTKLEASREELSRTMHELDGTKSRLSKLMGQKLTDNNPNIADLSDKNRPTKLAERYTELYDNQWTDAFEIVDQGNEEKTIGALQQILYEANRFCRQEADAQMQQLRKAVLMTDLTKEGQKVPDVINKQLKDCRKASANTSADHLYEKYRQTLSASTSSSTWKDAALKAKAYLRECFDICWLMSVQDPPVVLGKNLQHGETFNSDIYKAYTRSGPSVEYVVWPALYLYEDGAILCKGVAQGYGERKSKYQ